MEKPHRKTNQRKQKHVYYL